MKGLIFFLIRIVGGGVQTGSTRHVGHFWPIVPASWWLWGWRIWWNKDWQRKQKYSEKTCPSATLSTTNPTWLDPGDNPGRRGGKPANNRLSYGAVSSWKDNETYSRVQIKRKQRPWKILKKIELIGDIVRGAIAYHIKRKRERRLVSNFTSKR
jgi:hypothetical protein